MCAWIWIFCVLFVVVVIVIWATIVLAQLCYIGNEQYLNTIHRNKIGIQMPEINWKMNGKKKKKIVIFASIYKKKLQ